ncbi:transposase [Streptomyces sp. NPDC046876]|uniref:IS110 family transposase n=1 Tax=Streptomyces sp. NPDC046876 TaxID=3155616 RepID=UPI0033D1C9FE
MAAQDIEVVGGIDTHADLHQAAVIDGIGRHLATQKFETTPDGYRRLLNWLHSHGEVLAVGIEGTGAYGAEIARFLTSNAVTVIEVDRPDRKARRDNGKSDPIDAYAAATAVLSGRAGGTPKARNGIVEAIRSLRVVRKSAVKARTQTINQIRTLIVTAPSGVRDRLRGLSAKELVDTLARSRPAGELAFDTFVGGHTPARHPLTRVCSSCVLLSCSASSAPRSSSDALARRWPCHGAPLAWGRQPVLQQS